MPIDVRAEHLALIHGILQQHLPVHEVIAFGSRVTGNARKTSDLDLAIMSSTPLPFETLAKLKLAFSESNLPYTVDLVDWSLTSATFREIIKREGVAIFRPTQ